MASRPDRYVGRARVAQLYLVVYTPMMEVSVLVLQARHAAGLTQSELAQRARTAQPAVAAYETGARTPTIATLERLLGACDHDLEMGAAPRVRRGASSLHELAPVIRDDLADGRESDARRLIFGFADDFRGSSRPGRLALIEEEPALTGHAGFDAALAGLAEFFAAEADIPSPSWVNGPGRFAEPWWFVATRPAFHAYTLANTPAVFVRHGVFIAREVFDRA
jgi:transcriptional regulator with XRE-family HTH domain